ncbi:fluoride efflux transporter CrcB [Jiangella rhizosphaerae]|uniref:Fluoride-specific ion channel FluC n=1 Tax=Jiangella rhizosphaerae TaxID=2293569 RepID=A0A418KHT1_9ACTN|nr:fluoride efflux transporter CrcB [Jiangella rhizosphaerae]RIQ11792.1 fluoride efflux transporter CrcB [Jiangella rhizosphaerae]
MTVLLVAAGAAVGAPLRYVVDRWVQTRLGAGFPWGTLVVNVMGSFVLGLVLGSPSVGDDVVALAGTGFCGALTTYSTFGYETLRLLEDGAWVRGVANVLVSLAAGLGAAALGWTLAW